MRRSTTSSIGKRTTGGGATRAVALLAITSIATLSGAAAAAPAPVAADAPASGGTILLTINGNLFTMSADGSGLAKLTSGGGVGDAAYSNDGTKIAFHKKGDLYVMKANGTQVVRLTATPTVSETNPSWSPDGTQLAFERDEPAHTYDRSGVAVMNARPGATYRLVRANTWTCHSGACWASFYGRPDWSPAGGKLAIHNTFSPEEGHSFTAVEVISLTGASVSFPGPAESIQPEFNPTGTQVATVYTGDYLNSAEQVVRTPVLGGPESEVTPETALASDPVWSPDGKRLLVRYNASGDHTAPYHVYVVNADGSGKHKLLTGSSSYSVIPRGWRAAG
ncbi:MAG: hypothetical protein V9G19_08370 [Tetrasphaera sp.]